MKSELELYSEQNSCGASRLAFSATHRTPFGT